MYDWITNCFSYQSPEVMYLANRLNMRFIHHPWQGAVKWWLWCVLSIISSLFRMRRSIRNEDQKDKTYQKIRYLCFLPSPDHCRTESNVCTLNTTQSDSIQRYKNQKARLVKRNLAAFNVFIHFHWVILVAIRKIDVC